MKPQIATRASKSDSLKKLKCLSDKFLVTYTNADCLSSKWEEFSELIKQRKPHLVVVTKVLPKHFSDPSIYFQLLPQYNLVSNNSAKRGICIYIHCSIKFSVVVVSLVDSVSECLLVDVKLPYHSTYMCIAAFYHSPTVNLLSPVNNANILACISRLVGRSSKFLILGDFNLPLIDWSAHSTSLSTSSYEQPFLDRLDDLYLYQHIDRPTQARNDAIPSILDLVITKSINDILSIDFRPPLGKSDHVVLDIYMNIDAQQRGFEFYWHDYAKADYESMRQFILSINIMYKLKNNHVSPDTAFDIVKKSVEGM